MPSLNQSLANVNFEDKQFVGAITFKSEELTLPDGSKIALGIDGGHWVLIYQEAAGNRFQVYGFDSREKKVFIDQKPGGEKDLQTFKRHVRYFFEHARSEDLVTLLPPEA